MTRLHVSLSALGELADQLTSFERALESRLAGLDRVALALGTTWHGSAASSYAAAHAACQRDLAAMHAALAALRGYAVTASDNYAAAVAANTRMWR